MKKSALQHSVHRVTLGLSPVVRNLPNGQRIVLIAQIVAAIMASAIGSHNACGGTTPAYTTVDQGSSWTDTTRSLFYTLSQGSQLVPLSWIRALQQTNGQPFLADSLSRYGYLPNENSASLGLPVGFTTSSVGGQFLGVTCAACHTRQIEVSNVVYRIDGGPAIVDIQSFLTDLDNAVGNVLSSTNAFLQFAKAVGSTDNPALYQQVQSWRAPFHALIDRGMPKTPWGVGRLDALGTIFNRVSGVTIGPPANNYLIADNIHEADAPVRYPFLWNAPKQDLTQWPGVVPNGAPLYALARNLGEVLGAFAMSYPTSYGGLSWLHESYTNNSVNFANLVDLELLVTQIGAPRWLWPVDPNLVATGKLIFERPQAQGGCAECHHDKTEGAYRFPGLTKTWSTPLMDVGTDSRQYTNLLWQVDTGSMKGATVPLGVPLPATTNAGNVVATAIIGTLLDWADQNKIDFALAALGLPLTPNASDGASMVKPLTLDMLTNHADIVNVLTNVNRPNQARSAPPQYKYESRRLYGIWAAAPYLHNGSVPTLAELLKPASARVASFPVGPAYDTVNVGLASSQTKFNYVLHTTDASDRNSGNSRAGHEYGTDLTASEKQALLEYLKTL